MHAMSSSVCFVEQKLFTWGALKTSWVQFNLYKTTKSQLYSWRIRKHALQARNSKLSVSQLVLIPEDFDVICYLFFVLYNVYRQKSMCLRTITRVFFVFLWQTSSKTHWYVQNIERIEQQMFVCIVNWNSFSPELFLLARFEWHNTRLFGFLERWVSLWWFVVNVIAVFIFWVGSELLSLRFFLVPLLPHGADNFGHSNVIGVMYDQPEQKSPVLLQILRCESTSWKEATWPKFGCRTAHWFCCVMAWRQSLKLDEYKLRSTVRR